jgi:hypothetical protein
LGRDNNNYDIRKAAKLYRLIKIRMKLVACSIFSKLSFDNILWLNRKRESIDIDNPKTFDDKMWYMKKHFYSSLVERCADKVTVRDYVKECGLENILVPICGIYDSLDKVDFQSLPDECYIKCNHSSGYNYLYRKNMTDEKWLKKLFHLYQQYSYYAVKREWSYKNIIPRIVVEKKLSNKTGEPLLDYRLFCFHGILKLVMVNKGTATSEGEHASGVQRSFYTPDFQQIPEITILGDNPSSLALNKPNGWSKMVDIAQILSKPFAFCRVDLYNIDGKVYLSEMTFFPNSGVNQFQPEEWALRLGDWIDLDRCRKNLAYVYIK